MDDARFNALLRRLVDAKADAERCRLAKTKADKKAKAIELEVHEAITARKDTSVSRDLGEGYGVIRFVPNATPYGTVIDEEAAVASLEELGHGPGLFEKKIRKKILNDLAKEANDHQADLPEGVGYYVKQYVTVTRT